VLSREQKSIIATYAALPIELARRLPTLVVREPDFGPSCITPDAATAQWLASRVSLPPTGGDPVVRAFSIARARCHFQRLIKSAAIGWQLYQVFLAEHR